MFFTIPIFLFHHVLYILYTFLIKIDEMKIPNKIFVVFDLQSLNHSIKANSYNSFAVIYYKLSVYYEGS